MLISMPREDSSHQAIVKGARTSQAGIFWPVDTTNQPITLGHSHHAIMIKASLLLSSNYLQTVSSTAYEHTDTAT